MDALTLKADDRTGLREATRTLVSPLEHRDVDEWRRAVNRKLKVLLGADKATFQFPGQGAEDLVSEEVSAEKLRPYLPMVRRFQRRVWGDPQAVFRRVVALGVCDRPSLYGRYLSTYYESEYYNEFIRPNHAHDALITAVPVPHGADPVQLYFHHERPRGGTFEPRAHALLRLLHPALEAGVRAQVAYAAHRGRLEATLDAIPEPTLLLDADGKLLHRNPAAASVLASDPEAAGIGVVAADLARSLGALLGTHPTGPRRGDAPPPLSRTVRTGLRAYRVRATILNGDHGPPHPLVLVTIGSGRRDLPDAGTLKDRFDLTDRQSEVALLLARRQSNREIARTLHISPHTARHHTEMVLRKLGISSRRKVRRRILQEDGPPGRS